MIRLRNEKLQAELSFKSSELASSTMAIIKKNEFLMEMKEMLQNQKEQLGTRYPDKYPDLTSSDLQLCAFLWMNLSSKEISPLLGISVRGVENHRYRLRKK